MKNMDPNKQTKSVHLKIVLQNTRRLTELKRDRDKSMITAEDLAPLSVSDGIYQKEKKQKIEDLQKIRTILLMNLTN